jgi:GDP-L-fucose synthase
MFFENKKVLVTGGTGLIGVALVNLLLKEKAKLKVVSIDNINPFNDEVEFIKLDLRIHENCMKLCENIDYVFHLAGVKGSPSVAIGRPASFFVPTVLFNTCLLDSAVKQGVKHILYTSSVGVYSPNDVFKEEDVWKTFPSENDRFAGWAKRMGELQLEAHRIEHKYENFSIVRPAKVYGPYDNFDPSTAMVIPSLINRALNCNKELVVWGNGSAIRDFIYSEDVARGMIKVVKEKIQYPINLGSGNGISIKELVENIVKFIPNKKINIVWDVTKPTGDKIRIMDTTKAQKIGFKCEVSIENGIQKTIEWYLKNQNYSEKKYNSFKSM